MQENSRRVARARGAEMAAEKIRGLAPLAINCAS
jgi:hypothetical protein